VVGLAHRDNIGAPGCSQRQAQRQVDGLRAAVDQQHAIERRWKQLGEAAREVGDRGVVEA